MNLLIFAWITAGLWVVFLIYWFVSALGAKESVRGYPWRREITIRLALIAIVFILIRAGVLGASFLGFIRQSAAGPADVVLGIIGVILLVSGIFLAIWARLYLGRNWGMPMTLQKDHKLIIGGPYAHVRHPIYAGFLLAILGSALADGIVWFFVLFAAAIYFAYSAKKEETLMLEQFPNEYPAYMKQTKFMIPYVW